MHKTRLGLTALLALGLGAVVLPAVAATGPTHKNVHFTSIADGAAISATESVLKVTDSRAGKGAGVQKITSLTATGGTDTTTVYYGNATAVSHDTFTLGAADANGVLPVTGHGHDVRGTGRLKHLTSTYTFVGTYDPKTTILHVKLTGKESY
jgi:hypothetical protein